MNAQETASVKDVSELSSSDSGETESESTDTALTSKIQQQPQKGAKSKRQTLLTNTALQSDDILNPQHV